MQLVNFKSIKDIFLYLDKEKIQTVEIRFLDNQLLTRSFSLHPKFLSSKIFTSNYFKFSNFPLLRLNKERVFKDPFLSHPTLVFFTNVVDHYKRLIFLKQQKLKAFYSACICIKGENNGNAYVYSPPPFDNNREIRDEIILASSYMGVTINSSFCKNDNVIALSLQSKNGLELLDSIEKIKYAALMVASVYNKKIDVNKGIFSAPSLLV